MSHDVDILFIRFLFDFANAVCRLNTTIHK